MVIIVVAVIAGVFVVQKRQKVALKKQQDLAKQQMENLKKEEGNTRVDKDTESVKDLVNGKYAFENVNTYDWQVYKNAKYNFTLKYPKDWEIQKGSSDEGEKYLAIVLSQKNAKDVVEGLKEGSIGVYVSTDKTKEPILTELKRLKKDHNISIWKTNVSGFEGYYFSGFGEGLRMTAGNYDFSITSSLTTEKTGLDDRIKLVLNGMIQTLHFGSTKAI